MPGYSHLSDQWNAINPIHFTPGRAETATFIDIGDLCSTITAGYEVGALCTSNL